MEVIDHLGIRPRTSEALSFGWNKMKEQFLRLFLLVIIVGLAGGPMGIGNVNSHSGFFIFMSMTSALAYGLLFYPIISFSVDYMFLQAIRSEEVDLKNVLKGFDYYLNIILAHLLVAALIGIAMVAFIIPGIIVACRLAFVPYLVIDKELDPIVAVETSWKLTKGHGWDVFVLGFLSGLIFIGGILCLFVGIFPAIIWVKASFASMYQGLLNEKDAELFA